MNMLANILPKPDDIYFLLVWQKKLKNNVTYNVKSAG